MEKIRVRYAPSPTGHLHIGNARTALFNYLFAKKKGGDFIIRIEDTDLQRNIKDGELSQLENLKWLGISWDESIDNPGIYGPYNQLTRHQDGIYQKYIDILLQEEKAYKCFCSSESLEKEAEEQKKQGKIPKYSGKCRNLTQEEIQKKEEENLEYTIRFKVENNIELSWDDLVKGPLNFNSNDVSGDFNILKRDGIPTYNFAVVIDDHLMEISHILRGEDHISNTPKQLLIYNALNFEVPTFGHMALITNETGKKLSKRDGGIIQFIEQYKELGYIPEALFNFISLLGWSPQGEQEIYSQEDLIEIFDENRLSKSSATFDTAKLTWINNNYMKALSSEQYIDLVAPFIREKYNLEITKEIENILLLYKDQISYGKEIIESSILFFENIELNKDSLEFLATIESDKLKIMQNILFEMLNEELTLDNIKQNINKIKEKTDLKGKNLFMPIRILLTSQMHGPDLNETIMALDVAKLKQNIEKIKF